MRTRNLLIHFIVRLLAGFIVRACAILSVGIFIALGSLSAWSDDTAPAPAPSTAPDDSTKAERVDTQAIQQKYWARGDESELGVVQNRLYSKAGRYEFSLLGGLDLTDPFLSVYALGGRFGYHFTEYFSLHLMAWKDFSGPSSTQTNLLTDKSAAQVGTALNTNPPRGYYGTEAQFSLLYGKLSLAGDAIIHYDLHFMAGLGRTMTDSGTDFTEHLGLGQQFFLGQSTFLNIDYRLMHYEETIVQQVIPTQLGDPVGNRQNYSNVITIGIGFLFGGGSSK